MQNVLQAANSLFREGNYVQARELYVKAQALYPELEFIAQSISHCDRLLGKGAQAKGLQQQSAVTQTFVPVGTQMSVSARQTSIAFYRIIGNSIDVLHGENQALENLRFQLEHESQSPLVQKNWVLNRIVDRSQQSEIEGLLKSYGAKYTKIPFDLSLFNDLVSLFAVNEKEVQGLGLAQRVRYLSAKSALLNSYVMNNNGARNFSLVSGRRRADWVLPFDGNIFINKINFDRMLAFLSEGRHPGLAYTCPMFRCDTNAIDALEQVDSGDEEPQILFGAMAGMLFDERFVYGRRPKVEMLWRLGAKGPWDSFVDDVFDPERNAIRLNHLYGGHAFNVVRLSTGGDDSSVASAKKRNSVRTEGVVRFFAGLSENYRAKANLICPELSF